MNAEALAASAAAPTTEAAGQIADHLQTAPRPQALRVRAIVRDDAIDDRSDDGEPDLDRSLPAFEMRMLRGIGHELTDNEGEAPAALRLEWQAVGAQRETNPDRLQRGSAEAESELADRFGGVHQSVAVRHRQCAMNARMLLEQFDDAGKCALDEIGRAHV